MTFHATFEPRTRNGISRPSARHLHLPLVDRGPSTYMALLLSAGQESNLLAVPSSHWTLTAGPKSSASMYSQDSYTNSPPVFSESRVDRRRFGVALSPSQDGPWRWVVQHASITPTFNLDLPSEELVRGELERVDEAGLRSGCNSGEGEVRNEGFDGLIGRKQSRRKTIGTVGLNRMYTTAHSQASRSTTVFGEILLRMSAHPPPQAQPSITKEYSPPTLPEFPPQILISLPSPGLDLDRDLPDLVETITPPSKRLASLTDSRNRSNLPSNWKPKRPPSPLPHPLRKKHGPSKHKRSTSDVPFIPHSPLPPLPPLIVPVSPIPYKSPKTIHSNAINFSSTYSLHPVPGTQTSQDTWDGSDVAERSLRMYLKARALKTATYAIHDGGIISPP